MHEYSVTVALFDYVPVVLTATALLLLLRGLAGNLPLQAPALWLAALLIPLGGACKATWKLLIALGNPPLPWLENLLFLLLAPGFAALCWGLSRCMAVRAGRQARDAASGPLLAACFGLPPALALALALALPDSRAWFFWLLACTIAANITLVSLAIVASHREGLPVTSRLLLAYNLVAVIAMSGLSRLPPGETTAWIQQSVNFSAQAALAIAFWMLGRQLNNTTLHEVRS